MNETGKEVKATIKFPVTLYWNIHGDLVITGSYKQSEDESAVVKAENISDKTTSQRKRRT